MAEGKKAVSITFTYDFIDYTLEYDRLSVMSMETSGFNIQKLGDFSYSQMEKLFKGAFLMHHPTTKESTIIEILHRMPDKISLWEKLTEMLTTTYESLVDEPDVSEDESKNIKWEVKG